MLRADGMEDEMIFSKNIIIDCHVWLSAWQSVYDSCIILSEPVFRPKFYRFAFLFYPSLHLKSSLVFHSPCDQIFIVVWVRQSRFSLHFERNQIFSAHPIGASLFYIRNHVKSIVRASVILWSQRIESRLHFVCDEERSYVADNVKVLWNINRCKMTYKNMISVWSL